MESQPRVGAGRGYAFESSGGAGSGSRTVSEDGSRLGLKFMELWENNPNLHVGKVWIRPPK